MGLVYGGETLAEYVNARREWSPDTMREPSTNDPTKLERLYWSLIMASEWAREKAKLISSSPGAITGELLLFIAAPDGRVVASSWGLCGHAGALRLMVRTMAEHGYETDPGSGGINDGDVFTCNDPVYGTSQNNDVYTTVPVFHEGQLIAWATGSLHIVDAGSVLSPMFGGLSPTTFTDGLIVPPMRTGQNFQQSKSWELMLHRRTRAGVLNVLDDKMKLIGALLIRDRILALVKEYGVEFFMSACEDLIHRDRREIMDLNRAWSIPAVSKHPQMFLVRQRELLQNAFPQAAEDFLMHVPVTVAYEIDGTITQDYAGASPQKHCAFNCYAGATNLAAYVDFPLLAGQPSISAGIFDVIRRKAESGSLMAPDRTDLGSVQGAVVGIDVGSASSHGYALSRFCRGYIEQAWTSEVLATIMMWDGEFANGTPFASADWTLAAVMPLGVAAWRDAIPAMVGAGNAQPDMGEAEEHELLGASMVYLARTLQPNVMCHGKFRGAPAFNVAFLVNNPGGRGALYLEGEPRNMSPISMVGMCGGYPALPYYTLQLHGTNARELIAAGTPLPRTIFEARDYLDRGVITAELVRDTFDSPPTGWPLADGDLAYTVSAISSSWGDPLDRDPRRVCQDLEEGWIDTGIAGDIYGTVAQSRDGGSWAVDDEATDAARARLRAARLERSVPVRQWWAQERGRVLEGDLPEQVASVYGECLASSEKFRSDFAGCWGEDAADAVTARQTAVA